MKTKFLSRIGQWDTPPYLRKCLTSLKALTLLFVMGLSVNVWGAEKTLIIDGSKLTGTATTAATNYTYGDFTITMSDGAKSQSSSGDNKFADNAILIGKSGKYIYNKTPFGKKITKFELYANKGASTKVSVGVLFSTTAISAYATGTNTYTATLSTVDKVYDCSSKIPDGAKYFWYQVTNSNNSQVMFRVTYEEEEEDPTKPSLSVSPATIDFGTVYQNAEIDAKQVEVTFANLTTNDVAAAISGSAFSIDKTGSFTSGDKITITPSTATLDEYEETLTLSATGVDDQTVTIKMNVVEAPVLVTYNKVTSVDDLAEGDVIVLASSTTAYGVAPTDNHTYIDAKKFAESSATLTDNVLKAADAYELTLAKSGDNWTMTSADGIVGTTAAKKMTFGSTASGNVTTWSISIDASANASITSTTSTYGTIKYNSTSPRFLNYASGQTDIQIFKKETSAVYSAITLATCENGSVSQTGAADLTSVASGTEITLGNTPNAGYTLDEYEVYKTGDATTKVTITDGKFKMPAYDVTVSATFKVAKVLNSVEITTPASKTEYWVNEEFSTDGLVLTAHFADGDEVVTPTSITTPDMTTAGEKTITVSFTEGTTTKSDEYTITVKAIENTKETAYTVAEAIALIDANPAGLATANVYVKGIVSTMISTYLPAGGGYLNYYVSEDGQTTSQEFEFYQNYKNSNLDKWTSLQDVQIGAQVIGYGTLTKYGETYEFNKNNYLVSYIAPENPKTTATITLSDYVTSLATDEAADEVTITYNGDGTLSAESSNTAVATAAIVEGKLVVTPVAAGSATITVSATETEEYTAATKSYNLTVTAGLTAAALPFEFDGGKNDINPANGIKADGLANDYSASPKLKFDGEGDYVLVKIASKAAQVSYKIKGAPGSGDWSGQFDVLESADGTAYTTVASHTELATSAETKTHDLLEGTRYIKFVFTTKNNGNVALGAINIVATKPKVDPEFTIANVDVVVEDMAALQITTNSDGAVTYTIDPDNEGIEIDGDVVYAYTEGTYTVTANKAETETYNAAQTTFTVSVSSVAYKTVEVSTFSAVNGGLLELGQFHSYKGEAGTAPAVSDGQIRLYQNGGYITISALPGLKIAKIDITTAMATSYNYKVDAAEEYALTDAAALAKDATANIAGLTADSVRIYCLGTDKNSRFYVSYLKVYYAGELETVSALAVDGATKTEYEVNDEVDHTGAVVTATFATAGDVDVTLNSTFTDPDMSTSGTKQVTANFAEQTATYDITIAAETPEITVDVTSVAFGTVAQNDEVDAKTVAVTLKAIAEATVAVTGDASAFDVTPASLTESGNITITPVTTAAGEFTATITISADGAIADIVLPVTLFVEAPETCDGTDDFATSENKNASDYKERTTTAGWSAVNAARTTISDNVFFTINGKTSAVGVITSPELEDGIASLKIRYANTFQETKGVSFRVDIKQGEDVVKTYTITKENAEVEEDVVYVETISDINVAGTYQIIITNLSPTSSSSNKDRLSIGRLCWTEYAGAPEYDETVRENVTDGTIGTMVYGHNITAIAGAVIYEPNYVDVDGNVLEFIEVLPENTVAGLPYIFVANGENDGKVQVKFGTKVPEDGCEYKNRGLVGNIDNPNLYITYPAYAIYQNQIRPANTTKVAVGRAYIADIQDIYDLDEKVTAAPRRRFSLGIERSMPTGFETIMMEKGMNKVIMNNQLYLIRDGKVFNAQGALVK
ncbi:MAG: bacterial Ig-like domain-containing protein [Bacteroidales bacterium]|nr:bacterial Ig-like domain-containing protein [Candidatus Colicola caccequi]